MNSDQPTISNEDNLNLAQQQFRALIQARLNLHFGKEQVVTTPEITYINDGSPYANFIQEHQPDFLEYGVLILALIPHVIPGLLANIIASFLPQGGDLPEVGGNRSMQYRGMIPTGETAQFILAGNNLQQRLHIQELFHPDHWFSRKNILHLEQPAYGEPAMSGRIILDQEIVELLSIGSVSKPRFSSEFPAEQIKTGLTWDDLVLHPATMQQILEIKDWVKYNPDLLDSLGMKHRFKSGYLALFYGPPGTGKTLTACLLGKFTSKDVFRIDLSRIVSKYIGETEKNLSRLFDKAENKDWILFFDEADALFGKRTDIRDAHDKYANQETAYLLQRVEAYKGLVILATNQRTNIDDAFSRRFQAIIHFPMPGPDERVMIWKKAFSFQMSIAEDIDWHQVARKYELTGAGIMNVAQYCAVAAMADKTNNIDAKRIEAAVLREYIKEGKIV